MDDPASLGRRGEHRLERGEGDLRVDGADHPEPGRRGQPALDDGRQGGLVDLKHQLRTRDQPLDRRQVQAYALGQRVDEVTRRAGVGRHPLAAREPGAGGEGPRAGDLEA